MIVTIPTSIGDLVDRITILTIKLKKITDEPKLYNIQTELKMLNKILQEATEKTIEKNTKLTDITTKLEKINNELWEIEDDIRCKESTKEFDSKFIELARSVYTLNDKRATLKREINNLFESTIKEEKSYKEY
jgi:chromosome segregation ATPase